MAKILLVEDDNNLREIYGARLTAEGYDIVSAPDGEEALALAVKEKPDLIITDVMMPKISGFDMLDILRNAPETKNTKVIMMTALSQAEDKERADKLGADLYLVKSQVTLEDVAASVRKILDGNTANTSPETTDADTTAEQAPEAPVPAPTPPPEPPVTTPVPPAPEPPVVTEQKPVAPAPQAQPIPVTPAPPAVATTPPVPAPQSAPPAPAPVPDPQPTPAPQATTPPAAEPPVPTPSSPSPAPSPAPQAQPIPVTSTPPANPPQPPKPVAKKIEVILPDSDKDKDQKPAEPAKKPEEPTSPPAAEPTTPTETTSSEPEVDPALSIGPNLAEALAEEEKSAPAAGSDMASQPADTTQTETANPSVVVKPQTATPPEPAIDNTPPKPAVPKAAGGERVIEPLNDPTQKLDLDALLAKEDAKSASTTPPTGPVQPSEPPANSSPSPEHPDDFSKISL